MEKSTTLVGYLQDFERNIDKRKPNEKCYANERKLFQLG